MSTKNVLFVCSQNVCRSVTGELTFRAYHPDLWVRSCGSESSATVPLNKWLLEWADLVVCFEREHMDAVNQFDHDKQVICLGIEDNFYPNDPELVMMLKALMPQFLDPLLGDPTPASGKQGRT